MNIELNETAVSNLIQLLLTNCLPQQQTAPQAVNVRNFGNIEATNPLEVLNDNARLTKENEDLKAEIHDLKIEAEGYAANQEQYITEIEKLKQYKADHDAYIKEKQRNNALQSNINIYKSWIEANGLRIPAPKTIKDMLAELYNKPAEQKPADTPTEQPAEQSAEQSAEQPKEEAETKGEVYFEKGKYTPCPNNFTDNAGKRINVGSKPCNNCPFNVRTDYDQYIVYCKFGTRQP